MVKRQNDVTLECENTTRLQCSVEPRHPTKIELRKQGTSDLSAGVISVVAKLLCMIKHQEATLKAQEVNSNS